MTKPKIAVIVGSIRPNRQGDKPAAWIAKLARESGYFDVEVVVEGHPPAAGSGPSKRHAEKVAATALLEALGVKRHD